MDWDEASRKGEIFWDKSASSPVLQEYLDRHPRAAGRSCRVADTGMKWPWQWPTG